MLKPVPAPSLGEEERSDLDKLLSADHFVRAPRVHAVLEFLVEALRNGRADEVNEQRIAEAVFHRSAGSNSTEDNIVRVTISNLRSRLEEYYRGEGRGARWILEVPKGKYSPLLQKREILPGPTLVQSVSCPEIADLSPILQVLQPKSATPVAEAPPVRVSTERLVWVLLAALLAGNIGLGYLLYLEHAVNPAHREAGFLRQFFAGRTAPVPVVVTDSNLQAYRMTLGQTVPLSSYIDRSYLAAIHDKSHSLPSGLLSYLGGRSETGVTSAMLAGRMQEALYPVTVNIRHPQDMSTRDFQRDSIILLGGPWVNPWGQLFESRLNFRLIPWNSNTASEIRNDRPLAGEPDRFSPRVENGFDISYARIAVLPNLAATGFVILLGSNRPDSLEAAGDFLTKPDGLDEMLRTFGVSKVTQLPSFEVVLEVKGVSLTPQSVRVVAHRAVPTSSK